MYLGRVLFPQNSTGQRRLPLVNGRLRDFCFRILTLCAWRAAVCVESDSPRARAGSSSFEGRVLSAFRPTESQSAGAGARKTRPPRRGPRAVSPSPIRASGASAARARFISRVGVTWAPISPCLLSAGDGLTTRYSDSVIASRSPTRPGRSLSRRCAANPPSRRAPAPSTRGNALPY